jgi:hypothetical protein
MANPEAIERGRRLYEEAVRAKSPGATLDWQQISTPANGLSEAFSVAATIDGRLTVLPTVTFRFLETSTDAEIGQYVDGLMNAVTGKR